MDKNKQKPKRSSKKHIKEKREENLSSEDSGSKIITESLSDF